MTSRITRTLAITAFITTATTLIAALITILALLTSLHPYAPLIALPVLAYAALRINNRLDTLTHRHP